MILRLLIALAAIALPGVAHADWHEASSAHFVVYSNDSPTRLREFATNLERFDKALRFYRKWPDPALSKANRLTVYISGDTDDVGRLSGTKWAAGFFSARAGGSVAFVPKDAGGRADGPDIQLHILLHEYAHSMMASMAPHSAYPLWFTEGWAEFHATSTFYRDGSVSVGEPPQMRAWSLMSGNALKADKLLTGDWSTINTDETRDGLYGRGWLLTHYLSFGGKRDGQLSAYLAAINQGKSLIEAAAVFGDLRELDKELERYKTGGLTAYKIPGAKLPIGEIAIRKLSPGEAATMNVRIRSRAGVDDKTAPGVYDLAKKACAPFPNDPAVQRVLAEAAYDARDYAVAEAAADRAIAADPTFVDAYIYKAMARMAVAQEAHDTSKESWSAIRKLLISANKLDTEDPEPLMLYYRTFLDEGRMPPKGARDGLYHAFELAPYDRGLRVNTASMLMNERDFEAARALLKPLAFDPHNRGLAKTAAEMLKSIDAREKESPAPTEAKPAGS